MHIKKVCNETTYYSIGKDMYAFYVVAPVAAEFLEALCVAKRNGYPMGTAAAKPGGLFCFLPCDNAVEISPVGDALSAGLEPDGFPGKT